MQVIFNIPNDKVQRVVQAIIYFHPIPQIWNADTQEMENQFTPSEWAKEYLRRFVIDMVFQYERQIARQEADTQIIRDDGLIN